MKIGASMRLFPRENYLKKIRGFYHDDGMIKVISGVRRCGKSCLMQCIAEDLRAEGSMKNARLYRPRSIRVPIVHERRRMERYVRESFRAEGALV